jgi:hypothetical protein
MNFGLAPNVCPLCRTTDQTQPVPGIVSSQAAYAHGQAHPAYATSGLAQMLSLPPARPPRRLVITGWVLTLLGVPLAVLFMLISLRGRDDLSSSAPIWGVVVAAVLLTFPIWLPGLICLVIGHVRMSRFRREAPLRDMAGQVWSTARYCFRDHVVFLPHGAHAPAQLARSLILDTAGRALTGPYAPPPPRT